MNYLNGQAQGINQQSSTITALQTYIAELTAYINQNNQKYTRNLQTLKQFYEDQINNLNDTVVEQQEEILKAKNQSITLKDLLQNRNVEIEQLKKKVQQLKQQIEELVEKNRQQRQKNQQVYEHMDRLRQSMQTSIDRQIQKSRDLEEDRSKLLIQIKQKQAEIRINQTQIINLEEKVAERYTLPQRMKDLQIQSAKDKTNISNLQQKLSEVTKQRDFSQTELERKRKQNQKLTIQANKSKGDLSYEIEQAVKKQKLKLTEQIENLSLENERKIYQIKDLEIKLKQKTQLCQKLQSSANQANETSRKMQNQLNQLKEDKNIYLNQFRRLKEEYEIVINNLENAIPEYQKKHWALQQENQDLNTQLDSLQQLLRQLKAMNDMEPVRKQYRQWAQLNLAAERRLPQQASFKKQQSFIIRPNETDISPDWDKLMLEIQKIQI